MQLKFGRAMESCDEKFLPSLHILIYGHCFICNVLLGPQLLAISLNVHIQLSKIIMIELMIAGKEYLQIPVYLFSDLFIFNL